MDSPHTPTRAPAPGHQQTSGTEADPTKSRDAKSESQTMEEAHSDKSRQGVAGYPLPPYYRAAEKGADAPDHVSDHNIAPRHNSIESIAFTNPTRTNTDCSQHSVASTNATAFSAIEEDNEDQSLEHLRGFDCVLTSGSVHKAFSKNIGSLPKTILGRSYTVESPAPSRSSSITQDTDHGAPVRPYNSPVPLSWSAGPSQRALTMPKEKSVHRHMRRGTPPVRQDSLPLRPVVRPSAVVRHPAPPSALPRGILLRSMGPYSPLLSQQPRDQQVARQMSLPLHDQEEHRQRQPPIAAHFAGVLPDTVFQAPMSATPEREMKDWLEKTSRSTSFMGEAYIVERAALDETTKSEATFGELKQSILPVTSGTDNPEGSEKPNDTANPMVSTLKTELETGALQGTVEEESGDSMDTDSGGAITPEETTSVFDDDRPTENVCNLLLQQVFGLRLRDLARAQDAWVAVKHCLEELSHIVEADASLPYQAPMPIRQRPGYPGAGPSDYAPTSGSPNGNGEHPPGDASGRKRNWAEGHREGNEPDDGEASGEGSGGASTKKPKLQPQATATNYSCPYRKRNPLRFNVRDSQSCATQGFIDMTLLKRHVKLFHGRKIKSFLCPRCKNNFSSQDALDAHIQLPGDKICETSSNEAPEDPSVDPEDGITPRVQKVLNERKLNSKIDKWQTLWKTLFPGDTEIPDHLFVPPVEWDEVKDEFERSLPQLKGSLFEASRALQLGIDPNLEELVIIKAFQVSRHYIFTTIDNSKRRVDGYLPSRRRRIPQAGNSPIMDENPLPAVPPAQDFSSTIPIPPLGGSSISNDGSIITSEPPEPCFSADFYPGYGPAGTHQVNGGLPAQVLLSQRPMLNLQAGGDKGKGLAQPHLGPAFGNTVPDLHLTMLSNEEMDLNFANGPTFWTVQPRFNDESGEDSEYRGGIN